MLVHPYDDEQVVAGQGTVALEMLRSQPDLEVLVVAVGGGGLIGGMATAAKALKPGIEVVGVQARRFPAMVSASMVNTKLSKCIQLSTKPKAAIRPGMAVCRRRSPCLSELVLQKYMAKIAAM